MRRAVCVLVLFTSFISTALAQSSAVPVGTVKAERKAVAKALDFVGRIEAVNRVEVRARITGYLEAVLFKEGDLIKEGAPLFHIEKGQFEAAAQVAEGALARSQAEQVLAEQQLQRAEDLLARKSGTVVARDSSVASIWRPTNQVSSGARPSFPSSATRAFAVPSGSQPRLLSASATMASEPNMSATSRGIVTTPI